MSKDPTLKKRVYQFYAENIEKGKYYVAKNFIDEGVPKTTVYRHISSSEQNKPIERKVGSGKKPQIATKENIRKIKKWMDHKDGVSGRSVARKLNCRTSNYCSNNNFFESQLRTIN